MAGVDPRGITLDLRQKALKCIKIKLNDYLKHKNQIFTDREIECLVAKFEHKVFQNAIDKNDYERKIISKLSGVRADNQNVSAASTSGDGLRNGMTADMITAQYQTSKQHMRVPSTAMERGYVAVQTTSDLSDQQFGQQIVQRDLGYSHQLSQQPMPQPLTMRHQRNIVPQTTTDPLDQLFGQQDFVQRDIQYPSVQQNRMPDGTFGTTNSMLSIDGCQPPVESAQQMPYQCSSPYLQVELQEQRDHSRDLSVQWSEIPCTNLISQNLGLENNHIVQSQQPSTAATSAISSFPEAETTNDWKLFMDEFQRAKKFYVPKLQKLHQKNHDQLFQAQIMEWKDRLKQSIDTIKKFLYFLNAPETELIRSPINELRKNLDIIKRSYDSMMSKLRTGTSRAQSLSSHEPIRPVNTMPVSSSTRFPSIMEQAGALSPLSSAANSPFYVPVHAKEQMDRRPFLHSVPQGIADRNTHFSLKQDPQMLPSSSINQTPGSPQLVKLQEKEKDIVDSTMKPMTNAAYRISQKSRLRGQTSSTFQESWLSFSNPRKQGGPTSERLAHCTSVLNENKRGASSLSNAGSVSQPKASILSFSLPSTPVTPSSSPKEIGNSVKSAVPESSSGNNGDSPTLREVNECQDEREVHDKAVDFGAPEVLASPVVSDSAEPENSQYSRSSKRPIDRLVEAVQSVSREALVSAVDDMRSAINETEELPATAFFDAYSFTFDDDLDIFLEEMQYSTDDVHKNKRMKRYFESVSRDVSTPLNNYDSLQPSGCLYSFATPSNPVWRSRPEPNQELLDEIRQTNNKLLETVTEVVSDSDNNSTGTIVRCTYKPEAMNEDIKRAFMYNGKPSIIFSVEFLVPSSYPNLPPKILDKLPTGCVGHSSDMTERAKSLFDCQVQSIDPLRVGKIAKLWNDCAKSVFLLRARCFGLDTFTSMFGSWERVLPDPSSTDFLSEDEHVSQM